MAQQTQSNTAPEVEFNGLLARGQAMVGAYKTASMPTAKFVPATKDFQNAWNASRGLVVDELDSMVRDNTKDKFYEPQKGSLTYEVVVQGLATDGKYGPRTAAALALMLWARMGTWEKPNGVSSALLMGIPADPRAWPQQYVANRAMFDNLFLPVVTNNPVTPPPPPAPAPDPARLPPVTPGPFVGPGDGDDLNSLGPEGKRLYLAAVADCKARGGVFDRKSNTCLGPVAPDPPLTFDDGSTVTALTKGKSSTATLVAVGLGVTVLGGIVWFAVRKKGRR